MTLLLFHTLVSEKPLTTIKKLVLFGGLIIALWYLILLMKYHINYDISLVILNTIMQ